MTENSPPAGWSRHVTVLALIALVAGFCLGALARETGSPWLLAIGVVAKPAADVATFAANAAPAATAATQGAAPTIGQWGLSLVPTNLVKAAVEENYLAIVISAVLFAAAMTRIKRDRKALLVSAFFRQSPIRRECLSAG